MNTYTRIEYFCKEKESAHLGIQKKALQLQNKNLDL